MTDNDIIVLHDAQGAELRFKRLASVPIDAAVYLVLVPEEPVPGLADNQALVFEVRQEPNGMAALNIVTDTHLITQVYGEYQELMLRRTDELARKKPE